MNYGTKIRLEVKVKAEAHVVVVGGREVEEKVQVEIKNIVQVEGEVKAEVENDVEDIGLEMRLRQKMTVN